MSSSTNRKINNNENEGTINENENSIIIEDDNESNSVQVKINSLLGSYSSSNSSKKKDTVEAVECPLCLKKIDSNLDLHFEKNHTEYECPFCVILFENDIKLQNHIREFHINEIKLEQNQIDQPEFQCPVCLCGLKDQKTYQIHVESHFNNDTNNIVQYSQTNCLEKYSDDFVLNSCLDIDTENDYKIALELEKDENERVNSKNDLITKEIIEKELIDANYASEVEHELLKQQFGMNDTKASTQAAKNLDRAFKSNKIDIVTYHYERDQIEAKINSIYDDGATCTKNLIEIIQSIPLNKNVNKRILCTNCNNYVSGFLDKSYGCGYRNTQILLSSIRQDPNLSRIIFNNNNKNMPSITKIQQLIEQAWSNGFDLMGKNQLGGVLYNTAKWIGASDVAAMFHYLKIKVELVDVKLLTNSNRTIGEALFDFVRNYFEQETLKGGFVHPIYLQHEGHSRTIFGVEIGENSSLLIFDPAVRKAQIDQNLENKSKLVSLFRKSLTSFKKKEYQLLIIRGIIESEEEYKRSKVLNSTKLYV